jgi:hypothetical protein
MKAYPSICFPLGMLADISHKGEKKEKEIQDVCGRVAVLSWVIRESNETSGNYSRSQNTGKVY